MIKLLENVVLVVSPSLDGCFSYVKRITVYSAVEMQANTYAMEKRSKVYGIPINKALKN